MCPLYPSHKRSNNELVFQQLSSNPYQQNIIQQDQILAHHSMYGSDQNKNDRTKQWRKLSLDSSNNDNISNDNHKKKISHRDIEKQRRQEMSALHASLRSLLPLEYIKGTRSMSDHMNGAVNCVKDLKNRIKELSAKRDELRKKSDSSVSDHGIGSSNNSLPSRVVIHSCLGGVEVMIISYNFREQGFPLSRVLEVLLREGIDVVSCVSTKVNQMLLLAIHIEVSDPTRIDLSDVQQKVTKVIP